MTSRDGTSIGYRRLGSGPGLIILHGTMSSGYNHLQLAEELATDFTVHLADRRGRGLSGPFGRHEGVRTEIEDLEALVAATGVEAVFGVSSGGLIALHASSVVPRLRRIAVYEPPHAADRSRAAALLARYDREIAEGRIPAALVTAMRGAEMGPAFFRSMPRWLAEWLTSRFMASQDGNGGGEYEPMRALAPTLHYDFGIVVETSGRLDAYRSIDAEVLLLGGEKSPTYLRAALRELEAVLPRSCRMELAGLDHAASWNADVGGNPKRVAPPLRAFFSPERSGR
ncbi:MAG: alpha/beta fold hydrolase [Candidatus Limnocylindria bacterium]